MQKSLRYRAGLADARRVVVKIGSRVLVKKTGRPELRRIAILVRELAAMRRRGVELVIVTSGAVGTGMAALGMKSRPTELPDQQMAAAVGQSRLMALYDKLFGARRCKVGQVLLTHDDFHNHLRLSNATRTMLNLLRHGVIPIVNENDVVAAEEIRAEIKKLGDNDLLAALVVKMIRADLLIILSTVDGLREPRPGGSSRRVRCLEGVTRKAFQLVSGKGSDLSTGGMTSKLQAAHDVARAGCSVVIADGRKPGNLARIMRGEDVGTLIVASIVS